jgi:hypothetical protein
MTDYPLFIGERMVRGRAKWRDDPQPLSRDAALTMFRAIERVASVEHVHGRGWYGVRRIASDVVEDVEVDERVQDTVLANRKSRRRTRYQERERKQILTRASDARHTMRGRRATIPTTGTTVDAAVGALQALGITLSVAEIDALSRVIGGRSPLASQQRPTRGAAK